ncbi:hypothetical protein ppKF707_2471 [Metapseudomonas furukawaii]|uniref:Uncharacterized protein n=1 Tax=Metapseudomonas furukawaii TaxID=1149133 RepID=A0AAD1FGF4_METFU|nr:hypothetical protein ppKF707_2471 [Pseudomonas furukawaii]BAU75536.1 hypothetical protein KF707C_38480 [Pseudomonas furukawaii]
MCVLGLRGGGVRDERIPSRPRGGRAARPGCSGECWWCFRL